MLDDDLELIFSRFGKILSCEVIRDKRTGDSLQYAFIEYAEQSSCEQAYFKMQGVLIDDHRVHVDFSQSVSKLSDSWRTATNKKRRVGGGGFGGVESLEKKRHYKAEDLYESRDRRDRYGMVHDEQELRKKHGGERKYELDRRDRTRSRSRSRSPRRDRDSREYDRFDRRRGDDRKFGDREHARERRGGREDRRY